MSCSMGPVWEATGLLVRLMASRGPSSPYLSGCVETPRVEPASSLNFLGQPGFPVPSDGACLPGLSPVTMTDPEPLTAV